MKNVMGGVAAAEKVYHCYGTQSNCTGAASGSCYVGESNCHNYCTNGGAPYWC